jgi:hypothetical protein
VLEPLTPELALIDPELARLARDHLPSPGEMLSSSSRALASDEDLTNSRAAHSRVAGVGDRVESSVRASSSVAAGKLGVSVGTGDPGELLPPGRPRRRRRVVLAGLGIALAFAAIYALIPDSTVREEAPTRAPTAPSRLPNKAATPTDRHQKARVPSKDTTRAARERPPSETRDSTVSTAPTQTRASSRVFIWPTVARATLYKVEFFRRGREMFQRLSSKPRLELPLHWVYRGRRYRLTPGTYSWRVSPAFGPRSRLRYGTPIIRSTWIARS